MPEFLRRTPAASAVKGNGNGGVCALCGKSDPPLNQASYDGLDVHLHRDCETEYRRKRDAKSQGNGKQPAVPDQAEPRPPVDHHAPGGLMDHVAEVIEGQLRQLDERRSQAAEATDLSGIARGEGAVQVEAPEEWATSDADAARYTKWFQTVRREKGEALAVRELREELDRVYVPPAKLQREIERIQRLAGH